MNLKARPNFSRGPYEYQKRYLYDCQIESIRLVFLRLFEYSNKIAVGDYIICTER